MATSWRRLAFASRFTSTQSPARRSQRNGQPNPAPSSGHTGGGAGFGDARCLQFLSMLIDVQVDGSIAHTGVTQSFRSTEQSWDTESYFYFRLSTKAAITSFKLEIGDNQAIEGETRPSKQARKLYNKAVHDKTPAAILREVEPGIYQANIGRIPRDVQVTIVVKYAELMRSNAKGELSIKFPIQSPPGWSSSSKHTQIDLNMQITQEDSIYSIESPTHPKLLSIKAGVTGAVREVETFHSLRDRAPATSLERPNQATVNVSRIPTSLGKDFELDIRTSNETQKTVASLFPINKFGHAVLIVTVRPCELFNGEQEAEWSIQVELEQPWYCCSSDLGELNLTRIPHHGANSSPSTFKFAQSPRILPYISHFQSYSVVFLLDFKGSTRSSLKSVRITARPAGEGQTVRTKTLDVENKPTAEDTLQQLCVSSILRDLDGTMLLQEHHQSCSDGRPHSISNLVSSAERLSQMYSVCNRWNSKVAADWTCDSDEDTDFNGPRLYENELSRLSIPTNLLPSEMPIRQNEYFLPHDGIDREVITTDICSYLGNDAKVKPGTYEDKSTGRVLQGYVFTAYRSLTSAMIADLKADSACWVQERNNHSGASQHTTRLEKVPDNYQHEIGGVPPHPVSKQIAGTHTSGVEQPQPQAHDPDQANLSWAAGANLVAGQRGRSPPPGWQSLDYNQNWFPMKSAQFPARRQGPRGGEPLRLGRIWPQIQASRSANGTFNLHADLRDSMAAQFSPRTWEWLVTRIETRLRDDAGPPGGFGPPPLEHVANTMLALAFVKICIPERHKEIEQYIRRMLKTWYEQQDVLEELVLRVVVDVGNSSKPRRR